MGIGLATPTECVRELDGLGVCGRDAPSGDLPGPGALTPLVDESLRTFESGDEGVSGRSRVVVSDRDSGQEPGDLELEASRRCLHVCVTRSLIRGGPRP